MAIYNDPLGAIINPMQTPQMPTAAPPRLPQMSPNMEIDPNVSGWDRFLQKISDPNVSQALINAGTAMMSPRQLGETHGFKVGQGLAAGAGTLQQNRDVEIEQGFERQRLDMTQQQADTNAAGTQSSIARDKAQIDEINAELDPKVRTAKLDLLVSQAEENRARAKDTLRGGSSLSQPSGDIQAFLTRYQILSNNNPQGRSKAELELQAWDDTIGKAKEFKEDNPELKRMDAVLAIMKDTLNVPRYPRGHAKEGQVDMDTINLMADEIVKPYRDYYDSRNRPATSTAPAAAASGDPKTDPNARYRAFIQMDPTRAEEARMRVITAFGLPPTWMPQ